MSSRNLVEIWEKSLNWLNLVWHFELYKSGDNSIAFNQVFIALILFVIGILISKRIASSIGKKVSKIGNLNENTTHALQRIISLTFIVIVAFIALPIAGIPITIFTVLGSAVAIGVGFGAQNLFNNLISGLILMAEKPIRIGDIVDLGESQGKVADIGNRCTRIRRGDGVDVLVPNSHFLEQQVVNWTLFDSDLRGVLTIGVSYGSPTRAVEKLLLQAAREHHKVLNSKEPIVLFEDFGDNALTFNLLFWSSVSMPLDLRKVTSDLRFRIDELFAEAAITIAFPQRDIHLDTLKPLEVKMIREP
ncbi:MAG: small-conductance mechanosensitive channel [Candidatus Pelagisphaera sp.]|jgi:small-conductance mechanosensitive channel